MREIRGLKDISAIEFNALFSAQTSTTLEISRKKFTEGIIVVDQPLPRVNPDLIFRECCFTKNFILARTISKSIYFEDCIFEANVTLKCESAKETIQFRRGGVNGKLAIKGGYFHDLRIGCDCKEVEIIKGKFTSLIIAPIFGDKTPGEINKLELSCQHLTGNVKIDNLIARTILCKGTVNKEAEILLNKITFQSFSFSDVLNNGRIKLTNLKPLNERELKTSFSILNSNMGKTEFVQLDFRPLHTISFSSVYLIDSTFINIIWPERLHIKPYSGDAANLLDQKESYRQLKYSYSKQGDSILEHKFHGLEMEKYMEYLEEVVNSEDMSDKKRYWQLQQTLFVLKLSDWTSEFGQSLWRPIRTILVVGAPLFIITIMCGGIDKYYFSFCNHDVSAMFNTIPGFLSFINPLRKYEESDVHWGLLPDFLMRIVSSYCIYNFVRATRRFVK